MSLSVGKTVYTHILKYDPGEFKNSPLCFTQSMDENKKMAYFRDHEYEWSYDTPNYPYDQYVISKKDGDKFIGVLVKTVYLKSPPMLFLSNTSPRNQPQLDVITYVQEMQSSNKNDTGTINSFYVVESDTYNLWENYYDKRSTIYNVKPTGLKYIGEYEECMKFMQDNTKLAENEKKFVKRIKIGDTTYTPIMWYSQYFIQAPKFLHITDATNKYCNFPKLVSDYQLEPLNKPYMKWIIIRQNPDKTHLGELVEKVFTKSFRHTIEKESIVIQKADGRF